MSFDKTTTVIEFLLQYGQSRLTKAKNPTLLSYQNIRHEHILYYNT